MKKQTAVEWLVDQIKSDQNQKALSPDEWMEVIEQAKAMEKEQMEKCYDHATLAYLETGHGDLFEDYFNKTYGGDK